MWIRLEESEKTEEVTFELGIKDRKGVYWKGGGM